MARAGADGAASRNGRRAGGVASHGDAAAGEGRGQRPKRVTMRDVARAAGVSVQTVSNVVNDRSQHMTRETQARVREIIEQLGFRPNSVARGLRSARTQTLAFVVLDASAHFLADPMTDLFLAGLGDELRDASHGLLIRASAPGADLDSLIEPLVEGRADGAVVFLSGETELRARYIEQLREQLDLPFLLLEEHELGEGVATICADDRDGSREVCRHLLARGHERIGFLTAAHSWSAIEQRIAGYREAHEEAGIACEPVLMRRAGNFEPLDAALAAADLLDRHPRPTAIMCGNDLIALGLMKAARDRGLRVPDDLAVTGFNDFDFAAAVDPPLTTVRIPGYEMGRDAAAALIQAFATGVAPESRAYRTEIFLRGSA